MEKDGKTSVVVACSVCYYRSWEVIDDKLERGDWSGKCGKCWEDPCKCPHPRMCEMCAGTLAPHQTRFCAECKSMTKQAFIGWKKATGEDLMNNLYQVVVIEKQKEGDPVILSGDHPMLIWAENSEDAQRKAVVTLTVEQKIGKENAGELSVYCRPFAG